MDQDSNRVKKWEDGYDQRTQDGQILEEGALNLEHYHISAVCPTLTLPIIITRFEATATSEWAKMIVAIYNITGLAIQSWEEPQKAIFTDGSTVRWWKCNKDCLNGHHKEFRWEHRPLQFSYTKPE